MNKKYGIIEPKTLIWINQTIRRVKRKFFAYPKRSWNFRQGNEIRFPQYFVISDFVRLRKKMKQYRDAATKKEITKEIASKFHVTSFLNIYIDYSNILHGLEPHILNIKWNQKKRTIKNHVIEQNAQWNEEKFKSKDKWRTEFRREKHIYSGNCHRVFFSSFIHHRECVFFSVETMGSKKKANVVLYFSFQISSSTTIKIASEFLDPDRGRKKRKNQKRVSRKKYRGTSCQRTRSKRRET